MLRLHLANYGKYIRLFDMIDNRHIYEFTQAVVDSITQRISSNYASREQEGVLIKEAAG